MPQDTRHRKLGLQFVGIPNVDKNRPIGIGKEENSLVYTSDNPKWQPFLKFFFFNLQNPNKINLFEVAWKQ